jgi:hypothetical protein
MQREQIYRRLTGQLLWSKLTRAGNRQSLLI